MPKRSSDLHTLVSRGRLLNWLIGRSRVLWIDSRLGQTALRISLLLGYRPMVAWPGPVFREHEQTPAFSWFEMRADGPLRETFVATLNDALTTAPALDSKRIKALIHRVLNVCADKDASLGRGALHTHMPTTVRVAIIDERVHNGYPFARSTRSDEWHFLRMLTSALGRHPTCEVWLIRSRDPGRGEWLSNRVRIDSPQIRVLDDRVSFASVLKTVDHIYTLNASEGFLALLADVPVHVFGAPYYAGWGLTDDFFPQKGRRARPTKEALFHAVFISVPHYIDPATHGPGDLEAVITNLELQREMANRLPGLRSVAAIGFEPSKRRFVKPFLTAGGGSLRWVNHPSDVRVGECAALAGAHSSSGVPAHAHRIRLDDGFLHSCKVSSASSAPCSQVIDYNGIYFDPRQPSDLTSILNHFPFKQGELERAKALRKQIVAAGLTKYNLGRRQPQWRAKPGVTTVLVLGQTIDDASMQLHGTEITTMEALVAEVRKTRPDAWLVYRPLLDAAGRRKNFVDASHLADMVDTSTDIVSLIESVDEVHTVSSPLGFDALLREKPVFTYGAPFYAGWGLTHDASGLIPWRKRQLSLDMLVAGVLLRYSLYWDWTLNCFTTPEAVVRRLAQQASQPLSPIPSMARRIVRQFFDRHLSGGLRISE